MRATATTEHRVWRLTMHGRWTTLARGATFGLLCLVLLTPQSKSDGGDSSARPPTLGIPDSFLRLQVESTDRIDVVLLHHGPIGYYADWMECFYGQMLGFDIRTARTRMSASDAEEVTSLLLDSSQWSAGKKKCSLAGDVGFFLSGPAGKIQIMLELWCARVHLQSQGLSGESANGNIDAMQPRLLDLVRKYYPGDSSLARIKAVKR